MKSKKQSARASKASSSSGKKKKTPGKPEASKPKAAAKTKISAGKGAPAGKKQAEKAPARPAAALTKKKAAPAAKKTLKAPKKKAAPAGSTAKKKKAPSAAAKAVKKTVARPVKKAAPAAIRKKAASQAKKVIKPPSAARVRALREDIKTVLVTGASGCIGGFLVQHLLREKYSVVATDRLLKSLPQAKRGASLDLRPGNPNDPDFLSACMEGVDAVIHTAGHKPPGEEPASELLLNTAKETRAIYREAKRTGVRRFVLVGSATVYKRAQTALAEQDALAPGNEYEQNHLEQERAVLWKSAPGLPLVTILRPGPVYGAGCRGEISAIATLPPLVKALGPYYLKLSGGPKINLVHGEDVARAAIFLLLDPRASGEVFNLGDRDPMSFGDFVNIAMETYGLTPLGPGVPYPPSTLLQSIMPNVENNEIFSPLSRVSSLLWDRMIRKQKLNTALTPEIDRGALPRGNRNLVLDTTKITDLGFQLKHPKLKKGWEKTVKWYVTHGWVPGPEQL